MIGRYFYKNNRLLPNNQAQIVIEDIAYMYGFGVYETMKVRKGVLYFVEQHVERFLFSAQMIELEHQYTSEQIIEAIRLVVSKNQLDAANIKMLLVGGEKSSDAELLIIPLAPLFPDRKLYQKGANVISAAYERYLPQAKTLNMLPSYLLYRNASRVGAYDCLLVNRDGAITEGTRTNFYILHGRTIVTAPVTHVVEGVSRKVLCSLALSKGYQIDERLIPYDESLNADGAFVSSTSTKILPISQIDNHTLPEIPLFLRTLMKEYDEHTKYLLLES
ncbi:MAG: aminotransferase class IV [Patescibacteria group bacterium]